MLTAADGSVTVEPITELVDEILSVDQADMLRALDTQIDSLQAKFNMLVAIRSQLCPYEDSSTDESSAELPLAEPDAGSGSIGGDLETQIIQYVSKHGGSMPGDIAKAIGVHHTKIGRAVNTSSALAKDGKLVVLKLS